MWRLTAIYLACVRPQVGAALVAILVAFVGGFSSVVGIIRPVQAADAPVIRPVALRVAMPSIDISTDCAKVACLALTFDDGPSAEVTPRILDILDAHHAKATFFVIGQRVAGNEALLKRMQASGYEIGNHSWSHRKPSELSPQELEDEISRTQQAVAAAGVPAPKLFRPPYGEFNAMIRSHAQMTVIAWNVDPEDWNVRKPEKIVEAVTSHAKPGAIVDLHDIRPLTADALDAILTNLEQQYQLVTVSELLNLTPGQQGIFYGR